MSSKFALWTIGYEDAAVHGVVGALVEAGIEYEHLRDLGTPLEIRELFRSGELEPAREQYRTYLTGDPAAVSALARLAELAAARPTAILCFERDERTCHRLVICEQLALAHELQVEHLRP